MTLIRQKSILLGKHCVSPKDTDGVKQIIKKKPIEVYRE